MRPRSQRRFALRLHGDKRCGWRLMGVEPIGQPLETRMKLISGIVRPDKVDAVKAALKRVRVSTLTVAQVHDYAPQLHPTTVWLGHEYSLGFSIKHEVTFTVHDDEVDEAIDVFIRTARTGAEGDGHVSVISVDHRYNIRTGARDVS